MSVAEVVDENGARPSSRPAYTRAAKVTGACGEREIDWSVRARFRLVAPLICLVSGRYLKNGGGVNKRGVRGRGVVRRRGRGSASLIERNGGRVIGTGGLAYAAVGVNCLSMVRGLYMRSESQARVVRVAALFPVAHHRSLRPQVFRPVVRTIAQRKDECGSIMAMLCCALVAVALEVFNTGKAGVDAGAGMRDEGRGMDKRACLLEERWHCISFNLFLSHHHHRCIGFPEHT